MNILNKARELIRRIIEGIYCALGLGMPVHYVNSGEAAAEQAGGGGMHRRARGGG